MSCVSPFSFLCSLWENWGAGRPLGLLASGQFHAAGVTPAGLIQTHTVPKPEHPEEEEGILSVLQEGWEPDALAVGGPRPLAFLLGLGQPGFLQQSPHPQPSHTPEQVDPLSGKASGGPTASILFLPLPLSVYGAPGRRWKAPWLLRKVAASIN